MWLSLYHVKYIKALWNCYIAYTISTMGKVHPQALHSSPTSNFTSKQETFTLWMKSLVLNGKGCTAFDSNGQIVYRVDNYNCRDKNEVHLMDQEGNVLFTILRKVNKFHNYMTKCLTSLCVCVCVFYFYAFSLS